MNKYLTAFIFCLATAGLAAQEHDRVWLAGTNAFPGVPGDGHFSVLFGDSTLAQPAPPLAFNFNAAVVSVCDEKGELLFYSNGCAIANKDGQLLANGEGLNPGPVHDRTCPQTGYLAPQSMLALPWPERPGEYCLLHLGMEETGRQQWQYTQLYYSRIDMHANGGQGAITEKNQLLANGILGSCAAVRHGNGRDWWLIVPEHQSNHFKRFLLTPSQIALDASEQAGTPPTCAYNGSLTFNRAGNLLARWTGCKMYLFDFDRCSGVLQAATEVSAPGQLLPGGGLAFSPSGRFLYSSSYTCLYRIDLAAPTPQLDTLFYAYDPLGQSPYSRNGMSFQYMTTAPDNRIYLASPGRAAYFHVIEKPDAETRDSIGFQAAGLSLPSKTVRSLPQYPNYRLYDLPGSACDTLGINQPNATQLPAAGEQTAVQIMPNPASDLVRFRRKNPAECDLNLQIMDQAGRLRQSEIWSASHETFSIHLSEPGFYLVLLTNCDRSIQTLKLIVH